MLELLLLVGLIGLFIILRQSFSLALFLCSFTILPYVQLGERFVRAGFVCSAGLCFILLIVTFKNRTNFIYTARNKLLYSLILFTSWAYITSILNYDLLTKDSISFLITWTLIFTIFFLLCNFYSYYTAGQLIVIGNSVVISIVFCGVFGVVLAFIEQLWPDTIHSLYCPMMIEDDMWGNRMTAVGEFLFSRSGSFLGGPNAFGAFLIIPSIASIIGIFEGRRWVNIVLFLLFSFALVFLSQSRGAIGGLIIAALMFLWFDKHRFIFFGVVGIVSLLFAYEIWSQFVYSAYIPIKVGVQSFGFDFLPSFLIERLEFWLFAIYSTFNSIFHAFFGYGVSNETMSFAIEKKGAHSLLFSGLHFYGMVGLSLILNVLWQGKVMFFTMKTNDRYALVSKSAWYSGIGLVVHSLVDDVMLSNIAVMSIFLILLVPVVAYYQCRKSNKEYPHNN